MKQLVFLDYGMKDKNPIDSVKFYMKEKPDVAVRVRKDQVSQMLPEEFEEQHVRVYYKKDDKPSIDKVLQSFHQWCKKNNFPSPQGENLTEPELTPYKKSTAIMSSGTPSHKADNKNPETPGSAGKFKNKLCFK